MSIPTCLLTSPVNLGGSDSPKSIGSDGCGSPEFGKNCPDAHARLTRDWSVTTP